MGPRPLATMFVGFFAVIGNCHANDQVDFSRDVLPILRRVCWECHGPKKQEGGLRLDQRNAALRGGDSGPVITAGKSTESELLRRVSLPKGDSEVMPSRGEPLTQQQITLIRQWLDQGATWPENLAVAQHWSYVAPARPKLPTVRTTAWPRTAVDYFVLARLEREGLQPSPAADRTTLLRRVYFDLIGLPPTPSEIESFLQDDDAHAYEIVVERLLTSDQFGVRWARPWLDYARYADSHGFQRDDFRDLWPYRDWVVKALNSDMPFDQFSVEQLAGDLLPNATEVQRIATGFHRSAPTNVEAGSDPEETRVNQVFDRVNTLGMIWLGTSLECAQCHDHKYDPFTMRDYYGLFAFFNQTEIEADRSNPKVPGSIRFVGPEMELLDASVDAQRTRLRSELAAVEESVTVEERRVQQPDAKWETQLAQTLANTPREHVLEIADFDSLGGATHEILPDKSVLLSGEAPDRDTYTIAVKSNLTGIRAFKLEALTDASLPGEGPGRGDANRPNFVLQNFQVESAPLTAPDAVQPVAFTKGTANFAQAKFSAGGAVDNDPKTAWAIAPRFHEPHWAVFETAAPIGFDGGTLLKFQLVQHFGASRTIGRLRLSALTGDPNGTSLPPDVSEALAIPAEQRTAKHAKSLSEYRLQQQPEYQRLLLRRKQLETELKQLKPPTTLVMREIAQSRSSFMLQRGNFRTLGEPISPATPAALTSSPPTAATRLDLARWLVSQENPLVARVTVNRWWLELFGHGIVATPEDFGLKGESPTHPELLDWLAVEYRENGWSLKSLLRTIVLSATYRQSAKVTPEALARDDQNWLYARGPRLRLDAEAIRDNALAVAGLLSLCGGGSPIRPYQPDGLWVKVGGQRYEYEVSPGDEQYRRGLYVVWKRAAPYPSFVNFDANSRLACRVRRPRSNTPLQALTLLNDPVYVEAAVSFARRVLSEKLGASKEARIRYAHLLALARQPRDAELTILTGLLEAQLRASAGESPATKQFAERWPPPSGIAPAEFAAWYSLCAALLNLDETITKP